ncbi:MAG: GxGYxYP domain-containing protein, partial [Armatimonadota bacterium]
MRNTILFTSAIIMLIGFTGCSFGQNKAEGLPESIKREVKNANMIVSGTYSPVTVWEAEGKAFTHRVGHATKDLQASGGKAWTALTDKDSTGHIIYGPYVKPQPGDYVAFFRIKLLDEAGSDEDLGLIDAASGNGANLLQSFTITAADLEYGKYVQIPLAFRYLDGPLECRMVWTGVASVSLDSVTLYKLESGNPAVSAQQITRIPQVQPTGEPNNLVYAPNPNPLPEIFPTSKKPASTLDYMDISNLAPDWQLLLQSLQGIVNREKPVLYLKTCPQDGFWMDWIIKQGWVKSLNKITDPKLLLKKYISKINGAVVTDPTLASSKNIATMVAGVKNVVVVSPRLAKQLSLPIREDLRGMFKNDAQGYRWAFDNMWDKMNHNLAACLWPHANGVRDYLVQNKVFIFWIPGPIDGAKKTSAPEEQMRFVEELLSKMPANTPIMGYSFAGVDIGIGEGGGVGLMAEFGKYLVGSISTANISVHSGFKVPPFKQKKADPAPKLQKDKVYITLTISDGDNIPVITTGNWPQIWKNKMRGDFPIAWTISPASSILIPDIM